MLNSSSKRSQESSKPTCNGSLGRIIFPFESFKMSFEQQKLLMYDARVSNSV